MRRHGATARAAVDVNPVVVSNSSSSRIRNVSPSRTRISSPSLIA